MGGTKEMRALGLPLIALLGAIASGCGQGGSGNTDSELEQVPAVGEPGDRAGSEPGASSPLPEPSSNDGAEATTKPNPVGAAPSGGDGTSGVAKPASAADPASSASGADPDAPTSSEVPADAADPPDDSAAPDAFAGGSRFVIPQAEIAALTFGIHEYEADQGLASASSVFILDDPGLGKEYPVNFDSGIYRPPPDCSDPYQEGHFEVRSIQIEEDLDGQGTHLSIEPTADGHVLRHDGPGRHRVVIEGVFVIEQPELTNPEDPESYFPAECELVPWGSEQPVSFSSIVLVKQATSAVARTHLGCGDAPFALSGRPFPIQVTLLDEDGATFFANNVASSQGIDVIVETEGEATLDTPAFGLGSSVSLPWAPGATQGHLVVSGAPQKIRLSTRFGPLFSYELVELGDIDEWQVDFRYSRMNVKIPLDPLVNGATYPVLSPDVFPSRAYIAETILKVKETPVCSPIVRSDFMITASGELCSGVEVQDGVEDAVPGTIAGSLPLAGTCSVQLAFPAARGGAGLSLDFRTSWVDDAQGWQLGPERDASKRGCKSAQEVELQDMFDAMWLAQFECDVIDADLRIDGSIDSSLFESLREVTGNLAISQLDPADDLSGFANLHKVGGALSLGELPTLRAWEFPGLTEAGGLQILGSAGSPLAGPARLSFPQLVSVGDVAIANISGLQTIAMPLLTTANQLVLNDNDDLTELELPALTSVPYMELKYNPALAQCAIDQLSTQIGGTCTNCQDNDELATCP